MTRHRRSRAWILFTITALLATGAAAGCGSSGSDDLRSNGSTTSTSGAADKGDVSQFEGSWKLESASDSRGVTKSPATKAPTLEFAADASVNLFTGCNRGRTAIRVEGSTISFDPPAITRMACKGEAGTIEQMVLAVLTGKVEASFQGDTLVLTKGTNSLTYRKAS